MMPQTGIAGFVWGVFIAVSCLLTVFCLILPAFVVLTWLETGELSRVHSHVLLVYVPQSIIWGVVAWKACRAQFWT